MSFQNSKQQFFFIHIPKTGGISFREILKMKFKKQETNIEYIDTRKIFYMPQDEFNKLRLIQGHFVYSLVNKFSFQPIILTMLRHPIERSISHILHIKRSRTHWINKYLPIEKMTITDIIEEPIIRNLLFNFQVRVIGMDYNFSKFTEPEKMLYGCEQVNKGMLEKAKNRLCKFHFFGLVEHFEESIKLFTKYFVFPLVDKLPMLNVATNKSILSHSNHEFECKALIAPLLKYDMQLYKYAHYLFWERYNSHNY